MKSVRCAILIAGCLAVQGISAGRTLGEQRALLVGCTRYANLPQRQHLHGPANDVALMHRLLQRRFGFTAGNIAVLAEPDHLDEALAAYEMDLDVPCERPTAVNIEREFERLIDEAGPGDQIFILLAGHGSRQPDLDADVIIDPEPDGFDEVFLPRDVGTWVSSTKAVQNAICDDQLRAWTTRLVEQGAFVFFVADSCHSGSVTRGGDDVTSREVSRSTLGIPDDFPTAPATATGPSDAAATGWLDAADRVGGAAGLVALYAAQPDEEAVEFNPDPAGPTHGRLSYSIHEIFEQCDRAVTYSELKRRLLWTYGQRQWTIRSTPDMEGTDLDREVLGVATWQGRSDLTLLTIQDQLTVSGGAMQGITGNSILAVHPPAGSADAEDVIGYVTVTESRPFSALVEPVAIDGREAAAEFPDHSRCQLHFRDPGDLQISVSVEVEGFDDEAAANTARDEVRQELAGLDTDDSALFHLVETSEPADWYVVARPGQTWLQKSGSRFSLDDPDGVRGGRQCGEVLGPMDTTRGVQAEIRQQLERIAWASNLIELSEQAAGIRNPQIDIQLEVVRDSDEGESVPFQPGEESESNVRDGDSLQLKVTNCGHAPASLIVFYVDSHYGVELFFPYDREEALNNRIGVGESLYKPITFEINASTVGWEHVLVFAIPATESETIQSLRNLQQAGVGVRARGGAGPNASPLARLVERAAAGTRGATRPDEVPVADSYAVRRIMWRVVDDE